MGYTERKKKTDRQFTISLKSEAGNTVAFVNLTEQFVKAVLNKPISEVSLEEISAIGKDGFAQYLASLTTCIEEVKSNEPIDVTKF